jgi:methionyl-tRNA formyltransferase
MLPVDTRIVFMGSPDFAIPVLAGLINTCTVVGVVTQPDRPSGRGNQLTSPPVKILAEAAGIAIIQPEKIRQSESFEKLCSWKPDLIVVAAFGQILRQNVLELPRYGCINVHASYLPRWRGAAPIQAAIREGDPSTGVTIMKMDAGIDTGDILAQREIAIRQDDNAEVLGSRLAVVGSELLLEILPQFLSGEMIPKPQLADQATYAPMLKKEDGLLQFDQPGKRLERLVRAYTPWPGTYFNWKNQFIRVIQAHFVPAENTTIGKHDTYMKSPAIGCSDGWFVLDELQPAGKKAMPGKVFLNGARDWLQD